MKQFLVALILSVFATTSYASNCRLIETRGVFSEDLVCEIEVSEESYEEILDEDLLDGEEFSFRGTNYRLIVRDSALEKWIPIVDDLKVLAKDVKTALSKASNAALTTAGLTDMQKACVLSVAGTVTEGLACGGCISAATGTAGAIAALCKMPCGVAGGSLATAIIACRGDKR